MYNLESTFQRQKTQDNFYQNKDKENLDDNIKKYFNQFEEKQITKNKARTQLFEELQKNQEFTFEYDKKLLQTYIDINKLKGDNNVIALEKAQKVYKQKQSNSILPLYLLDPLIGAYEQKTQILTEELNESKLELKKVSKITKLLLQDNNQLRQQEKKRNEEFKKLLQKINENDDNTVNSLNQQLQNLEQQLLNTNMENDKLQEQIQYQKSYQNKNQKEVSDYLIQIQNLQEQISEQTWKLKSLQEYKFKTQPLLTELESQVSILQKQQSKEQMIITQLQNEKKLLKESYQKIKQRYEDLEEILDKNKKKNNKEKMEQEDKIDQLIDSNQKLQKQYRIKEQELFELQNRIQKDKIYNIPNESVISQFEPAMQIQINQAESIVQNNVKKNLLEQFQNDSKNYFDFTEYEQKYI